MFYCSQATCVRLIRFVCQRLYDKPLEANLYCVAPGPQQSCNQKEVTRYALVKMKKFPWELLLYTASAEINKWEINLEQSLLADKVAECNILHSEHHVEPYYNIVLPVKSWLLLP